MTTYEVFMLAQELIIVIIAVQHILGPITIVLLQYITSQHIVYSAKKYKY